MNDRQQPSEKARLRLSLRLVVIVLSAGILTGLILLWQTRPLATAGATPEVTANQALVGGPFRLTSGDGKPVTEAVLAGRLSLVYFGFTFCPDICPTELQAMAAAIDLFEAAHPENKGLVLPVFISVDPERDTPDVVKTYVAAFHPRMIGLTGSLAEVEAAKKAYRVYAAKRTEAGASDYTIDHSSLIFLMDRSGRYAAHFGAGSDPGVIAAKLAALAA